MKTFRYLQVNERSDGIKAKYSVGDLVKMVTFHDQDQYSWVSCGQMGLIVEVLFFIQESYDPSVCITYVTEYKVQWIDGNDFAFLDESMIIKMETK